MRSFIYITLTMLLITINQAGALEFNSGENQVQLIELYTSHSCSSCPPAESWLNRFKNSDKLWKQVIPLEFHVAYWNHLSWRDRYSKEKFSQRQRLYNQKIGAGVYTPQVIVNGKDFRFWRSATVNSLIGNKRVGNLHVKVSDDFKSATLSFSPLKKYKELDCFAAYLRGGQGTEVTSGENAGRRMQNEFVVIDYEKVKATSNKTGVSCRINFNFSKEQFSKGQAMVFWIVNRTDYQVIQATGGRLR